MCENPLLSLNDSIIVFNGMQTRILKFNIVIETSVNDVMYKVCKIMKLSVPYY